MARFKLTIEYEGTRYNGWQIQKGGKTIQGALLDACRELFKTEVLEIYGAGRTDGGVHASGQVAHLAIDTDLLPLKIKYGLNDRLPPDICIISVEEAHNKFLTTESTEFHGVDFLLAINFRLNLQLPVACRLLPYIYIQPD